MRNGISSIPNVESVKFQDFDNWQNSKIDQVPSLKDVPLSHYPTPIDEFEGLIARIDAVWSTAEFERIRTVSGGYNVGFEIPCFLQECPYIELDDLEDQGREARGFFEGKSWISGKYQEVDGGSGCLKWVNGGKEPTGRHPYGAAFKVSIEVPDETTDTTTTALYFRAKNMCGATPYGFGPFPWINYRVNDRIFLGKE